MQFAIVCLDGEGLGTLRARLLPAHRRYIDGFASQIEVSGPLMHDDGATRCGQLYIFDAPDRAAAQDFVSHDPFTTGGLFDSVTIQRFSTRFHAGVRPERDGDS